MRILFTNTAPIIKYGIGLGFQELGHDVRYVFLDQEESLYPFLAEFRPDCVFSDGGTNRMHKIFPLLDEMRIPHVYWAIEDPVGFQYLSLPYAQKSALVLTPCQESIYDYAVHGITAQLLMFACHPRFHRAGVLDSRFNHDLVFVGNNYNNMPARLKGLNDVLFPAITGRYDLKVYGNEWWVDPAMDFVLPSQYYGGYLANEDLSSLCSSTKIVLGMHSVDDSSTMMSMRTFEILGSRGFYLTQWTPAIEHLFRNHEHLVWSRSADETKDLINYYLARPALRHQIARQGQQEVYAHHTYLHRIQSVIHLFQAWRRDAIAIVGKGGSSFNVRVSRRNVVIR